MAASHRDVTMHDTNTDTDGRESATDRGETAPSLTDVFALVERGVLGRWECTLFAVDADGGETWIAASEGSFVSLSEME
jgi:hypothetical protein